jgi:lipid A 3-O-deacylase
MAASGRVAQGQSGGTVAPGDPALGAAIASEPDGSPRVTSWSAIWENDGAFIKPYHSSDRHYTNGVKFDAAFDDLLPQSWIDLIPGEGQFESMSQATGAVLGQSIFTSIDIERKARQPDDRPYAGWLYVGVFYQRSDLRTLDHFELDVGVVGGDGSAAESIQKFIHSVVPEEVTPQGWDDQLANELGVVAKYQRRWRFRLDAESPERPLIDFDLIPEAGFMLGNVLTNANAAVTLRMGANLPDDFGPVRIAQFRDVTGTRNGAWSAYMFGRVGGELVGRNIFLDGNTFANSVSVGKKLAVGEVAVGVAGRFRKLELGWAFTWRTEEFREQDHPDAFGSLSLTWRTTF